MTRLLASPAVALAFTLALAACGGSDDATGPTATENVAGVYPLRSYNGGTLPLVVGQSATQGTLELTSGHVTLKGDGTFTEAISYKFTPPGVGAAVEVDSSTSSGRYAVQTSQIVFTFPEGEQVTASFANGTITVVAQATFVYRR